MFPWSLRWRPRRLRMRKPRPPALLRRDATCRWRRMPARAMAVRLRCSAAPPSASIRRAPHPRRAAPRRSHRRLPHSVPPCRALPRRRRRRWWPQTEAGSRPERAPAAGGSAGAGAGRERRPQDRNPADAARQRRSGPPQRGGGPVARPQCSTRSGAAEAQRMQALEATLAALREQTAQNQRVLLQMQSELAQARESRYRNPLVYALIGLLLLALVGHPAAVAPGAPGRGAARLVARGGIEGRGALHRAYQPFRGAAGRRPGRRAHPPAAQRERHQLRRQSFAGPEADDATLTTTSPRLVRPARPRRRRTRPVNTEELFDVQQQSDFFLSLGQHDQAIAVLREHIAANPGTSALAYLDLLRIYHSLGRKDDYARLARRVRARLQRRRAALRAVRRGGQGPRALSQRTGAHRIAVAGAGHPGADRGTGVPQARRSRRRGLRPCGLPGTAAALCGGQGSDRSGQCAARAGHAAFLRRHLRPRALPTAPAPLEPERPPTASRRTGRCCRPRSTARSTTDWGTRPSWSPTFHGPARQSPQAAAETQPPAADRPGPGRVRQDGVRDHARRRSKTRSRAPAPSTDPHVIDFELFDPEHRGRDRARPIKR